MTGKNCSSNVNKTHLAQRTKKLPSLHYNLINQELPTDDWSNYVWRHGHRHGKALHTASRHADADNTRAGHQVVSLKVNPRGSRAFRKFSCFKGVGDRSSVILAAQQPQPGRRHHSVALKSRCEVCKLSGSGLGPMVGHDDDAWYVASFADTLRESIGHRMSLRNRFSFLEH